MPVTASIVQVVAGLRPIAVPRRKSDGGTSMCRPYAICRHLRLIVSHCLSRLGRGGSRRMLNWVLRRSAYFSRARVFLIGVEKMVMTECANMVSNPPTAPRVLRGNSVKSSSRNLYLPPAIYEDDVIMWCITLGDVEEYCEQEGEVLTDEEMKLVFYILNYNWQVDYIEEAIQRLRRGDY